MAFETLSSETEAERQTALMGPMTSSGIVTLPFAANSSMIVLTKSVFWPESK